MNAKEIKSRIHKEGEHADAAIKAAAASVGNGSEALGEQGEELLDRLRDIGRDLLDRAKVLTDEANKQAHLRPLAVFGIAFIAGVIAARALRR